MVLKRPDPDTSTKWRGSARRLGLSDSLCLSLAFWWFGVGAWPWARLSSYIGEEGADLGKARWEAILLRKGMYVLFIQRDAVYGPQVMATARQGR